MLLGYLYSVAYFPFSLGSNKQLRKENSGRQSSQNKGRNLVKRNTSVEKEVKANVFIT